MVATVEDATRVLTEGIERAGQALDPLAGKLKDGLDALQEAGGERARRAKDVLNGTWLGHRLHAAISDAPLGAWTTGLVLDLLGERRGADRAIAFGVVAAVPTALSGVADFHNMPKTDRGVGVLHALLNSAALACYVGSLFARRGSNRGLGVGLSTTGWSLAFVSAYLGGELTFRRGVNVSRNAWDPHIEQWQVVCSADELIEGRLLGGEVTIEGEKIAVVLLRRGEQLYAINGKCSHMAGPLAEGKLVDEYCVECPWHQSTFDMRDGSVIHGPTSYPQAHLEVRVSAGNVEVRGSSR